jgi:hypothetical protein
MSLANLVPDGVVPPPEHTDVLLELAYLTTAVDGRLEDSEIAAFKDVVARLRGTPSVSNADLDVLFDKYGGNVEFAEISERVQAIAPKLPKELKALAFKLSVGLSVVDLDASDDESDLQVLLAESLGLDATTVDTLTAEVYASLDAGEDDA